MKTNKRDDETRRADEPLFFSRKAKQKKKNLLIFLSSRVMRFCFIISYVLNETRLDYYTPVTTHVYNTNQMCVAILLAHPGGDGGLPVHELRVTPEPQRDLALGGLGRVGADS